MSTKSKTTILITDEAYEELALSGIEFEEVAPDNGAAFVTLASNIRAMALRDEQMSISGMLALADTLDDLS